MGFNTNLLLSCLLIMLVVPLTVHSIVFKVGDAAGWSAQSHLNYARWSNYLIFLVGDDLLFVYDPNTTNVLQVTSPDYLSCNATSPLATHNTGNDTIPLTKYGEHYFISGNHVDCNKGLKLVIGVADDSLTRIIRSCPGCYDHYLVPKPPCCECPGCDDPLLLPRPECCDTNTSTEGATTAPTTSTPAGGAAVLTPTMSPNSTSAGGEAETRVMPHNSTTSAASKLYWNGLLVVAALFLH